MTQNKMPGVEVAELLRKPYGLTKKEARLLAYQVDHEERKIISEMCQELKTTPRTLLKTKMALDAKMKVPLKQAWEKFGGAGRDQT